MPVCDTSVVNPRNTLNALLLSLKAGRLIGLVSNDNELFVSHSLRLSESGSSRPGTSKRVFMVTRTSRVTTPEVVLGSRQGLFLPEGHPLLRTINRLFQRFGVQGRITATSNGPSLYQLELSVPVETLEGDALVSSLMSNRADLLILGEVSGPVVLLDN